MCVYVGIRYSAHNYVYTYHSVRYTCMPTFAIKGEVAAREITATPKQERKPIEVVCKQMRACARAAKSAGRRGASG